MTDDCSESERRYFFNSAGPQRHPRVARAPPPSRADALGGGAGGEAAARAGTKLRRTADRHACRPEKETRVPNLRLPWRPQKSCGGLTKCNPPNYYSSNSRAGNAKAPARTRRQGFRGAPGGVYRAALSFSRVLRSSASAPPLPGWLAWAGRETLRIEL